MRKTRFDHRALGSERRWKIDRSLLNVDPNFYVSSLDPFESFAFDRHGTRLEDHFLWTVCFCFQMTSAANTIVDKAVESPVNAINPAAAIPDSMKPFVHTEMNNLQQIATNFLARHFQFRTKGRDKTLDVVQLMSEYEGNFSTPVAYL